MESGETAGTEDSRDRQANGLAVSPRSSSSAEKKKKRKHKSSKKHSSSRRSDADEDEESARRSKERRRKRKEKEREERRKQHGEGEPSDAEKKKRRKKKKSSSSSKSSKSRRSHKESRREPETQQFEAAEPCYPSEAADRPVRDTTLSNSSTDAGEAASLPSLPVEWKDLPRNVLACIFSHIPLRDASAVSSVCMSWNEIFHASREHLHFVSEMPRWRCERLPDAWLRRTVGLYPSLRSLSLQYCHEVCNSTITSLFSFPRPCLESLSLANCPRVTNTGIIEASLHATGLTHLDLSSNPNLQERGIRAVCANLPNLRSLSLAFTSLDDDDMEDVSQLTQLHTLDVSSTPIFGAILSVLPASLRVLHLAGCKELRLDLMDDEHFDTWDGVRLLNLSHIKEKESMEEMDDIMVVIAECLVRLEALVLRDCAISDAGLAALAPAASRIRILDLHGCQNITDAGLRLLCEKFRNLRFLSLSLCPNVSHKTIERNLHRLPHLSHCKYTL